MTIREEIEQREELVLKPWACLSARSRGRVKPETPDPIRTCFMVDRDRIVHAKAFRRLKHKTQVYISPAGDHYRTRLTHTLEVSQIARTISRGLALNEDLTEAIALSHDIGHTPFSHAGEKVLNELVPGGFRHSENSVRVLTRIEKGRLGRGLNLSREVLDGVLNHDGFDQGAPRASTMEGQVIFYSDKIAYVQHDIDDAIRAGLLVLDAIPRELLEVLGFTHTQRISTLVNDVLSCTRRAIEEKGGGPVTVCMSPHIRQAFAELRRFMFDHVYNGDYCMAEKEKAALVVEYLFRYYSKHPTKLPEFYQEIAAEEGVAVGVADYISGMSDNYCMAVFSEVYMPTFAPGMRLRGEWSEE
ncbi:MAG: deoxyguanosinetriphosphate triphosphohydrolase [Syntrophomonadaceae bacterium]|jgi:dGTPase|nr:deoxyguanosinetriphosphate triphosphohydrolase [Syntrophomonadaceae bacterium]MDH7497922.1 deoxyguanosinetriphosphate triphosphohydrolase [Syntrophomonadaceae bacterium]